MIELQTVALCTNAEISRRWPHMNTVQSETLALTEEAGEIAEALGGLLLARQVGQVARAVVKRDEGTRGTPGEWTAVLRKELGQTLLVLLNLAVLEAIDVEDLTREALAGLLGKPDTEPMFHGA